ncbi:ASCH domain-containing protein [Bacillus sp. JJ1562]|uniref:ASCH domain-containing protein n=1 Tax=Bacillus sp. JJ1562 TaxID=3122960 RepID=UPI00300126BA
MNKAAQRYWDEFCEGKEKPELFGAWQFGADPDHLAQLVINGIKTATCSGYVFYEIEKEPLPKVDDYSILLNSHDEPVAIIKTVEVTIQPMNEVPEAFAIAEGDGTYQNWRDIHIKFFTDQLQKIGQEFTEDMLLVCERFELVDAK